MQLETWAVAHGVSTVALADLKQRMGLEGARVKPKEGLSESATSSLMLLESSRKGARMMRNNVGAGILDSGQFVRFGLMNERKGDNARCKSSDYIGLTPTLVTSEMVGRTLGVFTAREMKHAEWVYTGRAGEPAQLAFLNFVLSLGGNACFCTGEGTF